MRLEFSSERFETDRDRDAQEVTEDAVSRDLPPTFTRLVWCESRTSKIFDVLHHHAMPRKPMREAALRKGGIRLAVDLFSPCHLSFHVCMVHYGGGYVNGKIFF